MLISRCLVFVVLVCAGIDRTPAADRVGEYFADLNTFESHFTQTVTDSNGELLQDAKGRVWIQRPGRFRWDYQVPYRQLIVADGERLWTYDEDLEQATVESVDAVLSSTPAMLLSGFKPLREVMRWSPAGERDGMTWYHLNPKQEDAVVEAVKIAFAGAELAVIEVLDGFGNHTRIRFSDIRRNQSVDPARFRIELPPATDIIGDMP
jgi:outer membrane lipoprotein carrier protein